jgi:hypothetical protein
MKQFAKLTTCALTLGMGVGFWSCSNEEPVSGGNIDFEAGETAYLNITLRDANDLATRAGEDEEGSETNPIIPPTGSADGGYEYGTDNEGKVNMARFYFFDEKGIYVGQSNIWKDGSAGTDENIEFKSESLVVLDNLKGNKYPKYMVTVLNGEGFSNDFLNNKSLNDFSKELINWGENKEFGFLMVTSSYFKGANADANHDDKYPFATILNESDFARTPEDANAKTSSVNVYVERVATRVRLNSDKYFEVLATVAGANGDNPDAGKPENEAATKMNVRIDGWYVNGVEVESHLAKQLVGWDANTPFASTGSGNWTWNNNLYHRSYWGQSVNYNNSDKNLKFFPYTEGITNIAGGVDYFNENTSSKTNLSYTGTDGIARPNQQKMTSVILKATVGQGDSDNTFQALDLVEHNGLYFTKERFINYVLASMGDSKLPCTRVWDGTGEGTPEAIGKYIYTPLKADSYEIAGKNNEDVYVVIKSDVSTDLYFKNGDKAEISVINANLQNVTKGLRTRAFTGGAMYYNIPIAHLNSPVYDKKTGDLTSWEEGSFGAVRNHSYDMKINSIKKLGQGVFDPKDKETPIKPDEDPKDPNWYLGATINILSWKIVTNNVDL